MKYCYATNAELLISEHAHFQANTNSRFRVMTSLITCGRDVCLRKWIQEENLLILFYVFKRLKLGDDIIKIQAHLTDV